MLPTGYSHKKVKLAIYVPQTHGKTEKWRIVALPSLHQMIWRTFWFSNKQWLWLTNSSLMFLLESHLNRSELEWMLSPFTSHMVTRRWIFIDQARLTSRKAHKARRYWFFFSVVCFAHGWINTISPEAHDRNHHVIFQMNLSSIHASDDSRRFQWETKKGMHCFRNDWTGRYRIRIPEERQ